MNIKLICSYKTFSLVERACSFATESKNQGIIAKAAEALPLDLVLSNNSHSTRWMLKHVQKKLRTITIVGDNSVVSACNAIVEMKGSVSLQHLMWHRNTFYSISA